MIIIGLMMKNIRLIEKYLEELFPNPKCELNYTKDYELLIAVVLSAQTTDKMVNSVTEMLFNKYPDIESLSNADVDDISSIIKPIGTNVKKSLFVHKIANALLKDYNGRVPNNRDALEKLPGVGRKTANVVLSELFNIPAIAVDTHVQRVSKRLSLVEESDDIRNIELKLMKLISKNNWSTMHRRLVLFGRYHCKSKNPNCNNCELKKICVDGKYK